MKFDKFVAEIEHRIEQKNWDALRDLLVSSEPVDLALAASHIHFEYYDHYIQFLLESPCLSQILSEMHGEQRQRILVHLREFHSERLTELLQNIAIDDMVTILSELPEEDQDWFLTRQPLEKRNDILKLMLYDESTAGRIMTTEFIAVRSETTLEDCILKLRNSPGVEFIYYLFVLDCEGRLCGVVSLRDVLKKTDNLPISDIMTRDIMKVEVDTDREEVARMVERYNISAIPVVDKKGILRGIITVDDVIDVIRQESSEDIMKLAGSSDGELINRSPWRGFLMRMPWLLVSFFGGFLTIQSMTFFSGKISNILVLSFVPIIAGMGGNIGSQSTTLIVRGIALGNILEGKLMRVLFKELFTGVLLGSFFGLMLGFVSLVEFSDIPAIGLLAGAGIFFSMFVSALIGSLMPLIFKKCGVDPAVATGPFVTMAIDNICLVGYLGAAYVVLG